MSYTCTIALWQIKMYTVKNKRKQNLPNHLLVTVLTIPYVINTQESTVMHGFYTKDLENHMKWLGEKKNTMHTFANPGKTDKKSKSSY